MLEKLSIRERNLLVVLLGVILMGIIYFGLVKYLYPQYRQVAEELNSRRQDLADINGRIAQLDLLENKNQELQGRLRNLTNSFNKEVRNGINYYFIGKHAVDNGVVIREIIPQPYEDYGQYIKIPLKLTVRGKYRDVLNYIEQVENDMPNTSEIISMRIQPAGWDAFVEVQQEGTGETTKEAVEEATEEPAEETEENTGQEKKESILSVVVNPLSKKITDPQTITPEQPQGEASPLAKILASSDPDIDVKIVLITYAVKSPEIMELAKERPVGRLDAFSPAVDIPVMEPVLPEDNEDNMEGVLFPGADGMGDPWEGVNTSGTIPDIAEKEENQEREEPSVPEVIIKKKGDYSFPERETGRDKEETTNEE